MSVLTNDAGHGGHDPGAVNREKSITEKVYALEAALYNQIRLRELGLESDVTRSSDISLTNNDRTKLVSKYKYCISHHFNAGGGSGVEVIHSIYADGKFEHDIINNFRDAGYPVRPTPVYFKKNSKGQDYYFMHRETGNCRVTIVEYEFVDGQQADKLKDKSYREGMYECVIKAVCKRHGIEYKPPYEEKKEIEVGNVTHRIRVDGKQIGAFNEVDNILDAVKSNLNNNLIEIEKIEGVNKPEITVPETIIPNKKSIYIEKGNAQIIKTRPDNIAIEVLGDTLHGVKKWGVNGTFFDLGTAPVENPESCVFIAMNEGKAISNNAQFNGWNAPPRATLIYQKDKRIGFRQLQNINSIKDIADWAIGGYMVKPYMDFTNEQIPGSVNYKTNHTYIGADADENIYLIVKPNHMIRDIVPLLDELNIIIAIKVDGGLSSQSNHPDGYFRSDRKINTAVILKEV